jgi:chitinase
MIMLIGLLTFVPEAVTAQSEVQPWASGTSYAVGARVTFEGITYECRQAHTSLATWEPPNVPALWLRPIGVSRHPLPWTPITPYAAGVRVQLGDETYECLQSHVSLPTWEPANVPALWKFVDDSDKPLPRHAVIGYWHNFENGAGFIRVKDVSRDYAIVNLAFGLPIPGSTSIIQFVPDFRTSVEEVKSDIAILKRRGQKVLLSIGGATGHVVLQTAIDRQNFIDSVTSLIREYGFNGFDIDFEGTSVTLDDGDNDFRNPTTPSIVNLISAVRAIAANIGPDFILTMAPETFFVQTGYRRYGPRPGSYLPVIHGLRDILTVIHVQHYNTGSVFGIDDMIYESATADFQVAMAEMLLVGFPVALDPNRFFPPLRPDQVAIGLPASPQAAGSGYTVPSEVQKALDYLINGKSFNGRYVLRNPTGYSNFRGLMTWSINWDRFNNFEFSSSHRAFLDGLP